MMKAVATGQSITEVANLEAEVLCQKLAASKFYQDFYDTNFSFHYEKTKWDGNFKAFLHGKD